jgi:hypothetical protein
MDKRIQKLIERPNGHGEIYKNGERLVAVYYSLLVKRIFFVGTSPKGDVEIPGDWVITGQVAITGPERRQPEVIQGMTSGGLLSLHLADGRRWESISPASESLGGTFQVFSRSPEGLV